MRTSSSLSIASTIAVALLAASAVAGEFTPDNIFVGCTDASSETSRVIEFTPDGTYVRTIDASNTPGEYQETYGVAFGPDGLLYLGAQGTDRILRVAASGTSETWFEGDASLGDPDGLTFGPRGDLWVGSRDTQQLVRIDINGKLADVKLPDGYDSTPAAISFAPSGRRVLTSSGNESVAVLDGFGNACLHFDDAVGAFPTHALEQPDGSFVIADYGDGQLDLFAANGSYLSSVEDDAFDGPFGITRQSNGVILIADYNDNSLHFLRLGKGVTSTIHHADQTDGGYVAVAPYRFAAKLSAVVADEASKDKKLKSSTVQVGIQPGTGTVMVRFAGRVLPGNIADRYGPAYVFRGHLSRRAGDPKNALLHAKLPAGLVSAGTGSVSLQLKGTTADDGRFVIKKFSGTLTLSRGADTMIAKFQRVKALK